MSKLSIHDLALAQREAAENFPVGSFWCHNTSGTVYRITGHSIQEHDGQPLIHYTPVPLYDDSTGERIPAVQIVWTRTVREFTETVRNEDRLLYPTYEPRFSRVVPNAFEWSPA